MLIHSYPSIYNVGHGAVKNIFDAPVYIQEKIDGSQISFGIINGELQIRSKSSLINPDAPEGMFALGVQAIKNRQALLTPEWVYRGEYLQKRKHNTLAYNAIPTDNIILFDINIGDEQYASTELLTVVGKAIGLQVVPCFFNGLFEDGLDGFNKLLDTESCLGGPKIEGVVIKSHSFFAPDNKRLMAKYVSEAFREVHKVSWKLNNPSNTGIIDQLIERYKTDARWQKAVQHLREAGTITNSPKDIGALMNEVKADIVKEGKEDIEHLLYRWAIDKILRGATSGLAEWYKEQLLAQQFEPAQE